MFKFLKNIHLDKQLMKWANLTLTLINENDKLRSQINQTGILDGNEIILEFINNKEYGLAFEQLVYMITESKVYLTETQLNEITKLSKLTGIEELCFTKYKPLELDDFYNVLKLFNESQSIVVENLVNIWGMETPMSCHDWISWNHNIPFDNNSEIKIFPHGFGLSYKDKDTKIDFDFGENGEFNGFDPNRIWYFIEANKLKTVFTNENQIKKIVDNEVYEGRIRFSGYINYYKHELQH